MLYDFYDGDRYIARSKDMTEKEAMKYAKVTGYNFSPVKIFGYKMLQVNGKVVFRKN